ncbi:MAG: hypothetical protein O3B65_03230 [Chloroflexi bacterium]|nr:hypothetical protein [Chloroflexota bacterium]
MPRESVVDALNIIHRALRPGGMLLDVYPLPTPAPLELRSPDGATPVGQTYYSVTFNGTIILAEKAVAQVQRDGMFTYELHTDFDSTHHFTTVESWEQFRNRYPEDFVPATEELIATVHQAFADPDASLLMAESARATRYRANP